VERAEPGGPLISAATGPSSPPSATGEAKTLAGLQVEKAAVEGERQTVEADLGPVRYLATLLGAQDDDVLRWFILVVALLLDPTAVLLFLAATRAQS
jgi:hypothetical protein